MRLALYGKGNRWLRMGKQDIPNVSKYYDCVYSSIEDAMEDSKRFADRIEVIKIKDLDTKEIVYQGKRR